MYARIAREAYPLLAALVVTSGVVFGVGMFTNPLLTHLTGSEAADLGLGAWILGSALVASRSFSLDHQEGTLQLQFSQPVSRARIWWERVLVITATAGVVGIEYIAAYTGAAGARIVGGLADGLRPFQVGILCSLGAICLAAFWSGFARTTLGTFAFVAGTLWAFLLLSSLMDFGPWPPLALAVVLGGIGWHRFSSMQVAGQSSQPAREKALLWRAGDSFGLIAINREWPLRNLLAKELRLHRSTFLVAGVMTALAVALNATVWAGLVDPKSVDLLAIALNFVFGGLVAVISGSAGFCEERLMGTVTLNLLVPRRDNFLFCGKLTVSLVVFIALMTVVAAINVSAMASFGVYRDMFLIGPIALFLALFFASFWISSLARDAAQAAILAIPVFLALIGAGSLGRFLVGVLEATPLDSFAVQHISPRLANFPHAVLLYGGTLIAAIATLLLFSRRNFRNSGSSPSRLLRQLVGIAAVVLLATAAIQFPAGASHRVRMAEVATYRNVHAQLRVALGMFVTGGNLPAEGQWLRFPAADLAGLGPITPELASVLKTESHTVLLRTYGRGDILGGKLYTAEFLPPLPLPGNRHFQRTISHVDSFTR